MMLVSASLHCKDAFPLSVDTFVLSLSPLCKGSSKCVTQTMYIRTGRAYSLPRSRLIPLAAIAQPPSGLIPIRQTQRRTVS